ncbi:MAG: YfhO family protein [Taibaiella sp.]|nr:YfhO family protein [Taibaiella sp.]
MQFDIKKYKTDFLIVIGLAVLSLVYCLPQLQGKILNQHDNISWKGMAREGMLYHETTGKDVLWSNSMFGGMPTYTTYVGTSNTNYPGYLQTILQAIGKPAYFFFIAMLCFYLLMRVLNINRWLGMVGAVAYAFSTYNAIIISVGHETKMLTMGFLPAAVAGLYLIYKEKWLTGAAILGISFSLIFTNNHFQVIYYSFIMFGCFGLAMLFIAIKEGKMKQFFISSAIAAGTMALGIGPSMPSLLTTAEYAKVTMRGGGSELSGHDKKTNGGLDKEYAFRWSNGIGETFCLMIPYLYGGSSGEKADKAPKTLEAIGGNAEQLPLYWGPQPFLSGPVYFGAVVCFLFVLGLFSVKSPHKWWILATTLICIVLSWGKNFEAINYFLFDNIPYLNKFRTPSMALVIPQFLFPLLGIWGLQYILDNKNDPKAITNLKISAGITAGICLLLGVGGSMFFDFSGSADDRLQPEMVKLLREDRASLAASSGLKSAAFILIAAGLLWAFLKDKIKPVMLIAGLGALVALDLIPMSLNYLDESNYVEASEYESIFEPREVDKAILRDPDPYYRVLDLTRDTYNDAVQAYFHKCVGGYHPAKMETYQDLIDRHMSRGFNGEVLNMLNTKYIIAGRKETGPQVIPNQKACGNAWFVEEIKWAATAEEEMSALNAPEIGDTAIVPNSFSSLKTAVLRDTYKNDVGNYSFGKDSAATVKLAQYGLDDISFTSTNSKDGIAVFSDIYYAKGWKAYVDDKETQIMRANYVLRAIKIPAGSHKIEFRFRPETFYTGKKIALLSSVLLIALCLGALYPLFKKEKV